MSSGTLLASQSRKIKRKSRYQGTRFALWIKIIHLSGLFAKHAQKFYCLTQRQRWRPRISCLWGGRDDHMETTSHLSRPYRLEIFWNDWGERDDPDDHMETRLKLFGRGFWKNLVYPLMSCFSFSRSGWKCFGGLPLVFKRCWSMCVNFVELLIEASLSRRRYWCLSITTTPEPLSGLEMIMSSLLLMLLRALKSAVSRIRAFLCDVVKCDWTQGGGCQIFFLGIFNKRI